MRIEHCPACRRRRLLPESDPEGPWQCPSCGATFTAAGVCPPPLQGSSPPAVAEGITRARLLDPEPGIQEATEGEFHSDAPLPGLGYVRRRTQNVNRWTGSRRRIVAKSVFSLVTGAVAVLAVASVIIDLAFGGQTFGGPMGPLADAFIMLLCAPLMGFWAAAVVFLLPTFLEGWGKMFKAIRIGGEPDDYDPLEPKKPKARRWPYSELNRDRDKSS